MDDPARFQVFALLPVEEDMPWSEKALQQTGEEEGTQSNSVCKVVSYAPSSLYDYEATFIVGEKFEELSQSRLKHT